MMEARMVLASVGASGRTSPSEQNSPFAVAETRARSALLQGARSPSQRPWGRWVGRGGGTVLAMALSLGGCVRCSVKGGGRFSRGLWWGARVLPPLTGGLFTLHPRACM